MDDEDFKEELATDQRNFNQALDHLIDSVSHFKATGSQDLTMIKPEEWGRMMDVLQFATFVVSGLMYGYGINICGHEHDEDDDE